MWGANNALIQQKSVDGIDRESVRDLHWNWAGIKTKGSQRCVKRYTCPPVCLPVSVCLLACLCVRLSVCLRACLHVCLCLPVCLSDYLPAFASVCVSLSVFFCLPVCLSDELPACLHVCLCLPVCLSDYLLVCKSVCLFVCQCVSKKTNNCSWIFDLCGCILFNLFDIHFVNP